MSISLCGNLDVNTGAIACDNLKGNPVMPIFGARPSHLPILQIQQLSTLPL
jgi:hypothetical protein